MKKRLTQLWLLTALSLKYDFIELEGYCYKNLLVTLKGENNNKVIACFISQDYNIRTKKNDEKNKNINNN